eukprot:TRINITY_DN3697_c0_g1_i20.p1 TRINITY_DN3697_c0_g1~~TRINITY_DN3697_c0_g1_i20.p1  ORF type:complete len:111 (+),score=9.70 TRINITY_DN3697_c0_g1_i20:286-618(+)
MHLNSREEAVIWGQYLMELAVLKPVPPGTKFKDKDMYYYWHTRFPVVKGKRSVDISVTDNLREFLDLRVFQEYLPKKKDVPRHWEVMKKQWTCLAQPKMYLDLNWFGKIM